MSFWAKKLVEIKQWLNKENETKQRSHIPNTNSIFRLD